MTTDKYKTDSQDTKEKDKTKKNEEKEDISAYVKNVTWRHYMFYVINTFQSVGSSIGFPVMSQFFYAKLNKDYFAQHNITTNSSSGHRLGHCYVNKSSPEYLLQQEVQAINSQWSQWFSLCSGIPTIIMVLWAGSWVDIIGRKAVTLMNMGSHIFKYLVYGIFMKFDMPYAFLLIGYFLEGFGGSYFLSVLVNFAYTSDITPKNHQRAFFLVLTQNLHHIVFGLAHMGSGYFIRAVGFFWPLVFAISVNVLSMILFFLIVPETIERGKFRDLSPRKSFARITNFYTKKSKGKGRSRTQFWICLLAFAALSQGVLGEFSLDTLFVLNSPFCWNPVELGNYGAITAFVNPFLSLMFLRMMQCCLTEELIGFFSLGFFMARSFIKAFATEDWMIYLSGLIGAPGLLSFAMIRTIVSHLTDPSEQGSVFAGLGTVEALCGMTSSVMLNTIYAHSLLWMKGFVFIVVGISCTVPAALLLALHFVNKREKKRRNIEISMDTNATEASSTDDPVLDSPMANTAIEPAMNAGFEPDEKM